MHTPKTEGTTGREKSHPRTSAQGLPRSTPGPGDALRGGTGGVCKQFPTGRTGRTGRAATPGQPSCVGAAGRLVV